MNLTDFNQTNKREKNQKTDICIRDRRFRASHSI